MNIRYEISLTRQPTTTPTPYKKKTNKQQEYKWPEPSAYIHTSIPIPQPQTRELPRENEGSPTPHPSIFDLESHDAFGISEMRSFFGRSPGWSAEVSIGLFSPLVRVGVLGYSRHSSSFGGDSIYFKNSETHSGFIYLGPTETWLNVHYVEGSCKGPYIIYICFI